MEENGCVRMNFMKYIKPREPCQRCMLQLTVAAAMRRLDLAIVLHSAYANPRGIGLLYFLYNKGSQLQINSVIPTQKMLLCVV